MAVTGRFVMERPAPRVDVVDTVGAGDTFHAALLAWFDAELLLTRERIARLSPSEVEAALDFASSAAAIVCTRRGANPPTWNEVVRFMTAARRDALEESRS
jgi:fructokinase